MPGWGRGRRRRRLSERWLGCGVRCLYYGRCEMCIIESSKARHCYDFGSAVISLIKSCFIEPYQKIRRLNVTEHLKPVGSTSKAPEHVSQNHPASTPPTSWAVSSATADHVSGTKSKTRHIRISTTNGWVYVLARLHVYTDTYQK